jgi:hypothetical protein
MVFNPGAAQTITIDLSTFPPALLAGTITPYDLLDAPAQFSAGSDQSNAHAYAGVGGAGAGAGAGISPLTKSWSVAMGAGEVKAFGGFTLGVFAPRRGKREGCVPTDGYSRLSNSTTLQGCFLQCLQGALGCEENFHT